MRRQTGRRWAAAPARAEKSAAGRGGQGRPQAKNAQARGTAAPKMRRAGRPVLLVQLILCAALLGAAAVCRAVCPPAWQALRWGYEDWFASQDCGEELVRFAQAAADSLFLRAEAAGTKAAPAGCSLESYQPKGETVPPVQGYTISSGYGWRTHPISGEKSFHNGVDLACDEGTAIAAVQAGMVQGTGYDSLSGNWVRIRHANGFVSSYCHMQYVYVRAGEFVAMGETLGTAGQTGSATGPHLHFSVLLDDVRYDPAALLK